MMSVYNLVDTGLSSYEMGNLAKNMTASGQYAVFDIIETDSTLHFFGDDISIDLTLNILVLFL